MPRYDKHSVHPCHTPLQKLWADHLKAVVESLKQGPKLNVFITGHSLGAVFAQYMAAATQNAGVDVTGVYAFASPLTGGTGWVDRYR